MTTNYIYADTSIWNALCNQNVEAETLLTTLRASGAQLTVGVNAIYEMAKTFDLAAPMAHRRGQRLFQYLLTYLHQRIPVVRETWQLLQHEAAHVTGLLPAVDLFWDADEYLALLSEVEKLAAGTFDERAATFISRRKYFAKTARSAIRKHLEERVDVATGLAKIDDSLLRDYLDVGLKSPAGIEILQSHLADVFGRTPDDELKEIANKLLGYHRYRISSALVRDTLYLNWRCARRGSIRSDLPDETYHGVNASYCDTFVTTECDQADHAVHASPHLRSVVFDSSAPIAKCFTEFS